MATSVYQDGDTVYVGGYALNDLTGYNEAFLWVGTIPAPGATAVFLLAGASIARRGRRRKTNRAAAAATRSINT